MAFSYSVNCMQSKVQNNINLHTKLQNNIKESLAQAQNGRLTLSCSTLKFWNFQCSFLCDFLAPSVPGSGHEAAGRWMRNARRRRIFFSVYPLLLTVLFSHNILMT